MRGSGMHASAGAALGRQPLQQFEIIFDNPTATYFGGELVTGNLRISLVQPTRTRGIEMQFKGEARVQWSVERNEKDAAGNSVVRTDEHVAHELYFESRVYILGGPTSQMLLQPGQHMYSFSMQLPSVLPSSFEGKLGYVRYTVRATLVRDTERDHTAKAAFTVLCPLDLNSEPNVKNAVIKTEEKYLCCCCCKSGPITCVMSLPATGFVPGQSIPFSIEIDNITNTTISCVILSLQKSVAFTVARPAKDTHLETTKVVQMVLGGVAARDSCSWNEQLEVPSLPPSHLKHCSIIDVKYNLEVEVKIAGPHKNLLCKIPIVLGTIPIVAYVPSSSGGGPIGSGHATMPSAPPAYEECMLGPADIRELEDNHDIQGNLRFAPCYPMYRTQVHC